MQTTQHFKLKKPEETDVVNIDDLNANSDTLDNVLSAMQSTQYVSVPASTWGSAVPYTQTVNVPNVTATDTPIISVYLPASLTAAAVKAQTKAYGLVDRAVTGAGTITLYCYNKKPAADFQIAIKGV